MARFKVLMAVADLAGIAWSGSGAAVVAFLGKFMLAVVLGAIALGFFLRLVGRRRQQAAATQRVPGWSRAASLALAVVAVALVVEATNLPVRFDQPGFEPWHWPLVLVALAVAYPLNLGAIRSLLARRHVSARS